MVVSSKQAEELVHGSSSNIGFLLTRTASLWNEMLMKELTKLGFSQTKPSHGSVLIPIFDKGEQSITDIMKFSKLKKQTMTTYVRELLKLKLISQRQDPSDGRSKLLSLTNLGEELRVKSIAAVNQVNNEFMQLMKKEKFEDLQNILSSILDSIDQ